MNIWELVKALCYVHPDQVLVFEQEDYGVFILSEDPVSRDCFEETIRHFAHVSGLTTESFYFRNCTKITFEEPPMLTIDEVLEIVEVHKHRDNDVYLEDTLASIRFIGEKDSVIQSAKKRIGEITFLMNLVDSVNESGSRITSMLEEGLDLAFEAGELSEEDSASAFLIISDIEDNEAYNMAKELLELKKQVIVDVVEIVEGNLAAD